MFGINGDLHVVAKMTRALEPVFRVRHRQVSVPFAMVLVAALGYFKDAGYSSLSAGGRGLRLVIALSSPCAASPLPRFPTSRAPHSWQADDADGSSDKATIVRWFRLRKQIAKVKQRWILKRNVQLPNCR